MHRGQQGEAWLAGLLGRRALARGRQRGRGGVRSPGDIGRWWRSSWLGLVVCRERDLREWRPVFCVGGGRVRDLAGRLI